METPEMGEADGRSVADGLGRMDLREKILFLEPETSPLMLAAGNFEPWLPRRRWWHVLGGWADFATSVDRLRWTITDRRLRAEGGRGLRFSWLEDELEPREPLVYEISGRRPEFEARELEPREVDPLVRTRIFEPTRLYMPECFEPLERARTTGGGRAFLEASLHDPSPAAGSFAWWEGEAIDEEIPGNVMPWRHVYSPPVTPEEDEAWDALG